MEEIAKYFDGESVVDVGEIANADVKEKGIAFHAEATETTHPRN